MTQLLSFHGEERIKGKYLARVRAHADADEIVKGQHWTNGKGCAVGCTIHGDDFGAYETELGLPEWLARLEDALFENLSNEDAKEFPFQFLNSIPVGKNLDKVRCLFVVFLLDENAKRMRELDIGSDTKKQILSAVSKLREVYLRAADTGAWDASTASDVFVSVRSAAKFIFPSTSSAAAISITQAVLFAAAPADRSIARHVVVSAASSPGSSVWSNIFVRYKDKLLELLRGA